MQKVKTEDRHLKANSTGALTVGLLAIFLGTWLRFHRIEAQSLWYDEGNTARMTLRAPWDIVRAASSDIHPPGYYMAVTGWSRMTGRSEFSLRALSALSGIALLGFLYRLGRVGWGVTGGGMAAFLGAAHPALVYYSQEARMYMLGTMLGAVLVFLGCSLFNRVDVLRDRKLCYAYVMVAAAGLYTHYMFVFVLIAINLAALWRYLSARTANYVMLILRWFCLQLGAVILYVPWLPTAFRHLTTWPAERTQDAWIYTSVEMWHWLALGPTIKVGEALPGATAIAVLVVLGAVVERGGTVRLWLLVPVVLTLSAGLFSEAFAKFLLFGVPAVSLLASGGAVNLMRSERGTMRIIAFITFTLAIWFGGKSLVNLYTKPEYFRDDYRGIASQLDHARLENRAILLNAPNQIEVFSYYYQDLADVYPVARERPGDAGAQRAELARIAAEYEQVTVLYWGEEQSDPGSVVERWLNENTHKLKSEWYGQVRVARYSVAESLVVPFENVGALFGKGIELRGYSLGRAAYNPGDVVRVAFSWVPLEKIDTDYTVFVHLYSRFDEPPVAQHDGKPNGGSTPTGEWKVGVEVNDRHGVELPMDITSGEYTLAVGMYATEDGDRLGVTAEGAQEDRLILREISVHN